MKLGTTLRALPLVLVMLAIAEPGAATNVDLDRATVKGADRKYKPRFRNTSE